MREKGGRRRRGFQALLPLWTTQENDPSLLPPVFATRDTPLPRPPFHTSETEICQIEILEISLFPFSSVVLPSGDSCAKRRGPFGEREMGNPVILSQDMGKSGDSLNLISAIYFSKNVFFGDFQIYAHCKLSNLSPHSCCCFFLFLGAFVGNGCDAKKWIGRRIKGGKHPRISLKNSEEENS